MVISVHQPQYIPWLGYFDKIAKSDTFVFLDCVQYKPREFQNRNKIRTKEGWIWLSVPIISKGKGRQRICDVAIENDLPWRRKHLASLKAFYGNAPFFKAYFPFFEETYRREWNTLTELNVHIIKFILRELSLSMPIYFESQLDIKSKKTERIIEICKKFQADTYLSGAGGREYLEEEEFGRADIKLVYQNFIHPAYRQQFMVKDSDFIPYMSVLDLVFNEGEKSREILGIGGRI